MDIHKEISKSISAILRSDIFKTFGLLLLKYDKILTNNIPNPAATDYKRIYINPEHDFYKKQKIPIKNLIPFILLHEIGHIIFMHDKRGSNKQKETWGYATDFMLNLLLKNLEQENLDSQQNLISLHIEKIQDHICYDEQFVNMLEEEIYELLLKDGDLSKKETKQSYKEFLNQNGIPSDDNTSSENNSQDEEVIITETELEYKDKTYKKTFIDFPKKQSDNSTDNQSDTELSIAKTMFETNILSKGLENEKFKRFLHKIFQVEIPWKNILQNSILVELQPSSEVFYGSPRRTWLTNPYLPYLPNYNDEECLGIIVIAIDESASVSDSDVSKAIDIVKQSESYYNGIYVIKHDTKILWQQFYENTISDEEQENLLIRRHGGGTSHCEVFKKVLNLKKTFSVSLILCVTDMMSDIEQCQDLLPSNLPIIYLKNNDIKKENIRGKIIKI